MSDTETFKIKGVDGVAKAAEIQDALKKRGEIKLRISNDGLAPTIVSGDKIKAVKVNAESIKKGNIVLLVLGGEAVVRKVNKVIPHGTSLNFCLYGGTPPVETTICSSQILGKVVQAKRGNDVIQFETASKDIFKIDLGTLISRLFKKN